MSSHDIYETEQNLKANLKSLLSSTDNFTNVTFSILLKRQPIFLPAFDGTPDGVILVLRLWRICKDSAGREFRSAHELIMNTSSTPAGKKICKTSETECLGTTTIIQILAQETLRSHCVQAFSIECDLASPAVSLSQAKPHHLE